MSTLMFIIATVLFVLAGLGVLPERNLTAWGLVFLAAGHWIGQYV